MPDFGGQILHVWKKVLSCLGGRHVGISSYSASGHQAGWRSTILAWTCTTSVVLLINIIALICACANPLQTLAPGYFETGDIDSGPSASSSDDPGGSVIMYQGSCSKASNIKIWVHVAINILSALLLLASSSCMQCLSAPTRQEIDTAHAKGRSLDIGKLSAKNLFNISRIRCLLWTLLALSSVPLHFFYNSVISTSVATREYLAFVVSRDFTTSTSLNTSFFDTQVLGAGSDGHVGNLSDWLDCENTASTLMPSSHSPNITSMNLADCLKAFAPSINYGYQSVALVTSLSNASQVFAVADINNPPYHQQAPFACYNAKNSYHSAVDLLFSCENCQAQEIQYFNYTAARNSSDTFNASTGMYDSQFTTNTSWWVAWCPQDGIFGADIFAPPSPSVAWKFDGCLVESASEMCTVQLAPSLLGYVIAANAIKVSVMIYTLKFLRFHPLVTVGDAINSFLAQPVTTELLPDSAERSAHLTMRHSGERNGLSGGYGPLPADTAVSWLQGKRRWFSTVAKMRWVYSLGPCVLLEAGSLYMLIHMIKWSGFSSLKEALSSSRSAGFGQIDVDFYTPYSASSIMHVAMLSNLPQIYISTIYVLYYALISTMLSAAELNKFAVSHKALRVSPPRRGQQRSTYWLTSPLRYAIPLLFATTILHWLVSQGMFILRIDWVPLEGPVNYAVWNGIGFSPIAIVVAMAWGGVMIIAPVILGFKKLSGGVLLMGHGSRAIAVACCPDPLDPPEISELPLMYGLLPTVGRNGHRKTGFSSLAVESLIDGKVHEPTHKGLSNENIIEGAPGQSFRAWVTSLEREKKKERKKEKR